MGVQDGFPLAAHCQSHGLWVKQKTRTHVSIKKQLGAFDTMVRIGRAHFHPTGPAGISSFTFSLYKQPIFLKGDLRYITQYFLTPIFFMKKNIRHAALRHTHRFLHNLFKKARSVAQRSVLGSGLASHKRGCVCQHAASYQKIHKITLALVTCNQNVGKILVPNHYEGHKKKRSCRGTS